jgi:hypothetical protein
MAPRPRWWHQLQASKNEVLLAVDLYNRSGHQRQLEAFIVHVAMGWLKLFQARGERDGHDLYIREKTRRVRGHNGDWLLKPLHTLTNEMLADTDPRRASLEFFTGLRNRIEHRYERDIATLVAGRTQAWILAYERTLEEWFGAEESLSEELRFPIFLSSISTDAVAALKSVRNRVPHGVLEWVQDFDASLEAGMTSDQQFDFKIYLVPHTGPKSEADAAISFVRVDELTDDQRAVMDQIQTIIREKQVPVSDLGALLPKQVAERVSAAIERPFSTNHHFNAARYFGARPAGNAPDPHNTRSDFCRFNTAFSQYVYTEAWVGFLVRKLADEATYRAAVATARSPTETT